MNFFFILRTTATCKAGRKTLSCLLFREMLLYNSADTIVLHHRCRWRRTVGVLTVILLFSSATVTFGAHFPSLLPVLQSIIRSYRSLGTQRVLANALAGYRPERAVPVSLRAFRPLLVREEATIQRHKVSRKQRLKLLHGRGRLGKADFQALYELSLAVGRVFTAFPPHTCESEARASGLARKVRGSTEGGWLYSTTRRLLYAGGPQGSPLFPRGRSAVVLSAAKGGPVRVSHRANGPFWCLQYDSGECYLPQIYSMCLGSGKVQEWAASVQQYLMTQVNLLEALDLPSPNDVESKYRLLTTKDIIVFPQRKSYIRFRRKCLYVNGFIMHQPELIRLKDIVKLTDVVQDLIPLVVMYGRLGLTLQILQVVQSIRRKGYLLPRFTVGDFYVSPQGVLLLKLSMPLTKYKGGSEDHRLQGDLNTTDTAKSLQRIWNFTKHPLMHLTKNRGTHMADVMPLSVQVAVLIDDLATTLWDVKDVQNHPRYSVLAASVSHEGYMDNGQQSRPGCEKVKCKSHSV